MWTIGEKLWNHGVFIRCIDDWDRKNCETTLAENYYENSSFNLQPTYYFLVGTTATGIIKLLCRFLVIHPTFFVMGINIGRSAISATIQRASEAGHTSLKRYREMRIFLLIPVCSFLVDVVKRKSLIAFLIICLAFCFDLLRCLTNVHTDYNMQFWVLENSIGVRRIFSVVTRKALIVA